MEKKKYAPLVSKEVFKFSNISHIVYVKVNFKWNKEHETWYAAVYCPRCGHLHYVDGKKKRQTRRHYLEKFQCPECGYREITCDANHWEEVKDATIFKMADGSIAVSIFAEHHQLFIGGDNKTPFHVVKPMRARYIFNANGHTYYKGPIYIKDNKPVIKGENNLKPVTYMSNLHNVFPYYGYWMRVLVDKGLLPKDPIRRNRFHNASDTVLDELYYLLNTYHRTLSSFGRHIVKTIRMIDKNATDEDILRILIQRANMKNGGKKFRRMMAKNPAYIYSSSLLFHQLKLKDINSFYKLTDTGQISLSGMCSFEDKKATSNKFAQILLNKYGEKVLVDILTNSYTRLLFSDTVHYVNILKNRVAIDVIQNAIRHNIKETHNAMRALYQELQKQTSCGQDIVAIAQKCNAINSGQIQQKYIEAAKREIIKNAENLINNPIHYKEEEKKLEEKINDIQFYLPPDTDHLKMAGEKLHNCVGHLYRMQAYRKTSIIVLMKQAENFVGCIEINEGKIKQAYGPCNNSFKPGAQKAFDKWTAKHQLSATKTNHKLANITKEYIMPKYEDIEAKIKELAANIKIPDKPIDLSQHYHVALPF